MGDTMASLDPPPDLRQKVKSCDLGVMLYWGAEVHLGNVVYHACIAHLVFSPGGNNDSTLVLQQLLNTLGEHRCIPIAHSLSLVFHLI